MFSKRTRNVFRQAMSAIVVVSMLAQNPVFSQTWDTQRNEELGSELWRSTPPKTQDNAPEQMWQSPPNGPSPSERGTDYLWGNNPEPNTFDPESAWKQSENQTQQGATAGQDFTAGINADEEFPTTPDKKDTLSYGNGESVDRDTLFGGRGTDASARDAYGSDDELRNKGNDARARLASESSVEGQVYRLLEDQSDRTRPDYRDDPAWKTTDDILSGALSESGIQCDEQGGGIGYETCRRNFDPTLPQGCGFDRVNETRSYSNSETVFSYKGCFDHNYIDVQMVGADEAVFDAAAEGRRGYRVIPGRANDIADQWNGTFRVRSNRGQGSKDHLSGTYYAFTPMAAEEFDGVKIDEVSVQMRNINLRNNANFKHSIVRQPSPQNNWTMRIRIDDAGVSGGNPRCPYGRSDGSLGWVEFDIKVTITGTELTQDSWRDKKPSCEISDRQYGGFCEKTYSCVDYGDSGSNCITVDGTRFCDGLTSPPVSGIARGCVEVAQDWQCDLPGQTQADTCKALDEDPKCGHISSECAPGATQAPSGSGENTRPRREKNVFSFEGCFDHNRIELPIANASEASFDARFNPANPGYRVIPTVENQIDELWDGRFRVLSRNAGGPGDNLSGVYYAFRPYQASDLEGLSPQDFDIELTNLSLRNNAPFSYDIVQRPSAANNWTVGIEINDSGVSGGAPGCPFGKDDAPLGWAQFDLRVGFGAGQGDRESRCYAWEETYRCEQPQNNAACAAEELMGDEYADCEVTYEEEEYTKTVGVTTTETCQRPRELTSCEIERDISLVDRTTQRTVSEAGCFGQRTTSVSPGWGKKYTNVSASVDSSGDNVSVSTIEQPSASNNWSVTLQFNGAKNEDGECPDAHSGSARVKWTGQQVITEQKDFPAEEFNSPCLRESDGISKAVGTCVEQSTLSLEPHLRDELEPMFPGELDGGQVCRVASIDYQPNTRSGRFCYEGPSGQTICEDRDPEADAQAEANQCAALEQRMNAGECSKVETRPMGSGTGDTGIQYYFEEVYECADEEIGERTVTKTRTKEVYQCDGDVSCMGEECVNIERDVSGQFEKAVGLLDMLNSFGSDMECSTDNPESCRIFPGEAQKCKEALGGWVDCCETPGGVSLSNYIAVIKSTQKLDSALMAADGVPAVQGSWKAIRDPAVNAFDASKEFFTSAMDNITGSTTQAAGEAASEGIMSTWQDKAVQKTGKFLANNFPGAEDMFFNATDGVFSLKPGFSTALSVIGTAYTIYQLADLLVNIIWECSQKELQLGAERKLQKTHYIGSYCSQDTFFGCIEEKRSFCVFNAPLPRIVQEQVRPQLGMSWGSAKSPNCEGIPVRRLDEIDWTRVDLGEWVDLLDLTGNMPDRGSLTPEQITGSQSSLNNEMGRPDVIERTRQRAEGANIGQENEDARRSLWGEQ